MQLVNITNQLKKLGEVFKDTNKQLPRVRQENVEID